MGQQKRPVLIGGHSEFQTVFGDFFPERVGHAGVVDEYVQPRFLFDYFGGELTYRIQTAQVQRHENHVGVPALVDDFVCEKKQKQRQRTSVNNTYLFGVNRGYPSVGEPSTFLFV